MCKFYNFWEVFGVLSKADYAHAPWPRNVSNIIVCMCLPKDIFVAGLFVIIKIIKESKYSLIVKWINFDVFIQ